MNMFTFFSRFSFGCFVWMFLIFQCLYSEVLIIIPVYNRPDFIEFQYKTFKKFLKDDYRILMFNDADNLSMQNKIEAECAKYGIDCIRVPQELHNIHPGCWRAPASFRHGEVLQFAFNNYGFLHSDLVMIVDSDLFLLRNFSVREYFKDCDINLYDGKYFPLHFGLINIAKLKHPEEFNFFCRILDDGTFMDVGYQITHHYVPKYLRAMKVKPVNIMVGLFENYFQNPNEFTPDALMRKGYSEDEISFILSLIGSIDQFQNLEKERVMIDTDVGFYETNLFLDYRHGSNWHGPNREVFESKDKIVKNFLKKLVD